MWEKIEERDGVKSERLKVPGGWIVRTVARGFNGFVAVHQVFVPFGSTPEGHVWPKG